jgi:hypothetical protein
MRNAVVGVVAVLAVVVVTVGLAGAGNGRTNDKTFQYAVGLWGDLPYSDEQALEGIPRLIDDVNAAKLEFTVHDGDLKQGNGPPTCSDKLYEDALVWFNSLEGAAMFTPGDNDWTDCDRPSNGGFNSLERLDHERQVFFSTTNSLGKKPLEQEVQAAPLCKGWKAGNFSGTTAYTDVPCVENRRWTVKGVTYATLNVQGSCNNTCGDSFDLTEYAARNAADIAWLKDTFAKAKADGSAGVMLISQADPGFDLTGAPFADGAADAPTRNPQTLVPAGVNAVSKAPGFEEFLKALRAEVISFGRPVVYVHGDTHYFRVDKPLLDSNGMRLENFTRVETFRRQRR